MSAFALVKDWLDERFGWAELTKPLRKKTVPMHRLSYWYFLGGITLFLFIIQVCTGILLLLYYRASANEAFESVQYITTQVQFGWLVRSIHSWSANLMILTAFAHMFSVLFLKAYRKPRELTWITGAVLLFLAMGFGFSGYLLPWNTLAFFATKVGTEVAGQVPVIGKWIVIFLRGGEDVTGATLTRFFGFHVAVLPGITTLLLAIHVLLVQKFGISVPPSVEEQWKRDPSAAREMKFFPNFALREMIAWYIALGVLGALAALCALGPGRQGRSVRFRARRHQARVVLPVHVPDAEADSCQDLVHRRRVAGRARVRAGGRGLGRCCRSSSARTGAWDAPSSPGSACSRWPTSPR